MHEIKPVRKALFPCYPNKDYVRLHPELLDKLPIRWQRSRQAVAAAGLMASLALAPAGGRTGPPLASATPLPLVTSPPVVYAGVALPPFVSESDALSVIRESIQTEYPNISFSFAAADSSKPVVYIAYGGAEKGFQKVEIQDKTIDIFDTAEGLGIEYINREELGGGMAYTGDSVSQPDKEHAYVLVMEPQNAADEIAGEAEIRRQVVEFLDWLKAEGIV
jgi:hypothetical protein